MLAATCQICVACKKPVDFARILREPLTEEAPPSPLLREPRIEPARFSWGIFSVIVLIYFVLASLAQGFLGSKGAPYAMIGFVISSALWVYADARGKGIPKPAGWALACLLLWLVFFPWYVSRRRTPYAPCPIIEGEHGPVARAVILFLVLMTLVGAVLMLLSGDLNLK
jgi:hypothetical protein